MEVYSHSKSDSSSSLSRKCFIDFRDTIKNWKIFIFENGNANPDRLTKSVSVSINRSFVLNIGYA